jgi:hypothetical protein
VEEAARRHRGVGFLRRGGRPAAASTTR